MALKSKQNKGQNFWKFVKQNIYFIVVGILVVGISTTLVISAVVANKPPSIPSNTGPKDLPVQPVVLSPTLPMNNYKIIKPFSATELQHNTTFNEWVSHKAIDFAPTDDKNVYSILAGKVLSVEHTGDVGAVVTIEYEQGYKAVYSNLAQEVLVSVGEDVTKGQVIGVAGISEKELKAGEHLHFELYKDLKKINPSDFISGIEK